MKEGRFSDLDGLQIRELLGEPCCAQDQQRQVPCRDGMEFVQHVVGRPQLSGTFPVADECGLQVRQNGLSITGD